MIEKGWDLGYLYGQQAGMGLFGWIGDATGDCSLENITVSNTQIANYNWDKHVTCNNVTVICNNK